MPSPASAENADSGVDEPNEAAGAGGASPLANPRVRIILAIVIIAVLIFGGFGLLKWWTTGRFMQSTNDAFLQADQVTVAPRVAGYVDQVLVGDNQSVGVGQPLVRIDIRDPQAKLEQAQAQVDQALASVAQGQAQLSQQQAQIQQVQAQLVGLRSSAAYAAHEVERYSPLAQSGAETHDRLDQLQQNHVQAASQLAAGEAQLLSAQRQVQTLRAQIQAAQAQTEQAQAQVSAANVDVDAGLVRSSIAGRVGDRSVRVGQYVQPGVRLMTVVPVQSIYLIANFKETQLTRMRPGQSATIKIDALGGKSLHGVVDSFAPGTGSQFALIAPNNATGNFTKIVQRIPVRLRLYRSEAGDAVLAPGMSAEVVVDTRGAAR